MPAGTRASCAPAAENAGWPDGGHKPLARILGSSKLGIVGSLPRFGLVALLLTATVALGACSSSLPKQPPGRPPTPRTITREEPGGDAFDPHQAALDRLVRESWGWRNDKRDVFHFPLSDWKNWRRVRFWGIPAWVGFRYGDKHRAIAGLWVRRVRGGDPETPEVCLQRFEEWGIPIAEAYGAKIKNERESRATWKTKDDVVIKTLDADVASLFSSRTYLAVVGATLGWPSVCVVYGYAFEVGSGGDLAEQARRRYSLEAYQQLTKTTEKTPDGIE